MFNQFCVTPPSCLFFSVDQSALLELITLNVASPMSTSATATGLQAVSALGVCLPSSALPLSLVSWLPPPASSCSRFNYLADRCPWRHGSLHLAALQLSFNGHAQDMSGIYRLVVEYGASVNRLGPLARCVDRSPFVYLR